MASAIVLEELLRTLRKVNNHIPLIISGVAALAFYQAFSLANEQFMSALSGIISGFTSLGPFAAWTLKALMIKESVDIITSAHAAVIVYKLAQIKKSSTP